MKLKEKAYINKFKKRYEALKGEDLNNLFKIGYFVSNWWVNELKNENRPDMDSLLYPYEALEGHETELTKFEEHLRSYVIGALVLIGDDDVVTLKTGLVPEDLLAEVLEDSKAEVLASNLPIKTTMEITKDKVWLKRNLAEDFELAYDVHAKVKTK